MKHLKIFEEYDQTFGNWEGVDADPEISLLEYGFVAKQEPDRDYDDEWLVLYKYGESSFNTTHVRESELDEIVNGESWANAKDIRTFLNFTGVKNKKQWLMAPFGVKLSNLLDYWGADNVLGSSHMYFSEEEALKILNNE